MKILILGATGSFGLRLLPALLAHSHTLTIYVRSPSKLRSLVTSALLSHPNITIVTGDATDAAGIRDAIVKHKCDGVMNTAGQSAIFPWQKPAMQEIEKAVVEACVGASEELGWKLRVWFMGGAAVMDVPGVVGEGRKKMMVK